MSEAACGVINRLRPEFVHAVATRSIESGRVCMVGRSGDRTAKATINVSIAIWVTHTGETIVEDCDGEAVGVRGELVDPPHAAGRRGNCS